MSERSVHPIEYLGVLERRKWWFIVTFAVCAVAGIALALFLPPVYRSGAMVAVAAPTVTSANSGLSRSGRIGATLAAARPTAYMGRNSNPLRFRRGSICVGEAGRWTRFCGR